MYSLPHFKAVDNAEIIAFMHAHPFITLCGVDENNVPVATHVPVLIEERDKKIFLLAHIMRKQQHTTAFAANENVLAIFSGAHTYVSASWYENQRSAGTWNYQAVHAKGKLRFTGEDELLTILAKLTEKFENNPASPSLVKDMDKNYVSDLMKAIVAFEIEITGLEHVFKLSQNKTSKTYDNVVEHLSKIDGDAKEIAEIMQKRKEKVFPS